MRVAALLALACSAWVACGGRSEAGSPPDARWPLVRLLASDALAGRAPGTDGSRQARAAISAELARCGVTPPPGQRSFEQATSGPGVNLVGHLPGSEAGRHLVLSAHYDHLGTLDGAIMNGADDNAAAVGSVLAVACALAARPHRVTLVVALWDAEEPPHFLRPTMGSRYWVEHPHVPLASVEAAIVLDLVGAGLWPGSPLHVALGAESSPELAAAIAATAVPDGLVVAQAGLHLVENLVAGAGALPDGRQPWSDYHYFREAAVPVLFLSNGQSPRYHTPDDDFATLDLDKLTRQTTWLTALVGRLLDLPARPTWAPFERGDVDRAAARGLLAGALASGAFADAREALAADLAVLERLPPTDVSGLRAAVQRVQCFAARRYPAALCRRLGGAR